MKNVSKYLGLLFVLITVSSCDGLKDLADVTISDSFESKVRVEIPEGLTPTFTKNLSIDLVENEELSSQLSLIKDVKLNSLAYKISNYTGLEDAEITNVSVEVAGASVSLENVALKASSDAGTTYMIEDTAVIQAVGAKFLADKKISGSVTGTVSGTPVNFDVDFVFEVEVTLNPISD